MAKSANLSSSQDKKKLSRILDTKALQVDKLFAGSKFPTSPSFVKILIGVILAFGVLIFFLNTVDLNRLKSQTSSLQDNPPLPPPAVILEEGDVEGRQTALSTSAPVPVIPPVVFNCADVPVPAQKDPTPNGSRNGVVNNWDVVATLFYYGATTGGGANGNGVAYDSD